MILYREHNRKIIHKVKVKPSKISDRYVHKITDRHVHKLHIYPNSLVRKLSDVAGSTKSIRDDIPLPDSIVNVRSKSGAAKLILTNRNQSP